LPDDRTESTDVVEAQGLPMAGALRTERKDAARNRRRILDAAREVLAMDGPEGFTMDAVAAKAGVGKGTIFRRFGDREGLAEALIDEPMRAFQARILSGPPPLGPGAAPAERLEAFIAALVHLIYKNLDVVLTASNAPGHRRSAPFGFLLLHVEVLLHQIDEHPSPSVVARMLLGAVSADVIADARSQGADAAAVTTAALMLLQGLSPA
jgi:AcrR family transcriptional regulator